jgi:hypothetical protein
MSIAGLSLGLLIVLFTTLLLLRLHERKEARGHSVGTKNVPELRADHLSTETALPRVWRGQFLKAVV